MPARRPARRPSLLLLVRHGHTPTTGKVLPGRARGLHLSDKGRAQAQQVAERLGALRHVEAVYSSPLERARETAAPIAAARGLRVHIDKGLAEVDIGDWTGWELRKARRTPEWKIVQRNPSSFRFPNGESLWEMQSRMVETLARLRAAHTSGTIVAVSHADPIKAATIAALGSHLDLYQRVVISTCSVTAIAYPCTAPVVLTVNSVGALGDAGVS